MSNLRRFLWGCVGASVPLLLAFVAFDWSQVSAGVDGSYVFGLAIRGIGMMALGGFAVLFVTSKETELRTVLHVGMTWPAVLSAGDLGAEALALGSENEILAAAVATYQAERVDLQSILLAPPEAAIDLVEWESHIEHLDSIPTIRLDASGSTFLDGVLRRPPRVVARRMAVGS